VDGNLFSLVTVSPSQPNLIKYPLQKAFPQNQRIKVLTQRRMLGVIDFSVHALTDVERDEMNFLVRDG
jgi:hypothetical protein